MQKPILITERYGMFPMSVPAPITFDSSMLLHLLCKQDFMQINASHSDYFYVFWQIKIKFSLGPSLLLLLD